MLTQQRLATVLQTIFETEKSSKTKIFYVSAEARRVVPCMLNV